MDIQSEKLEVIQLLLETNDSTTIEAVKNILTSAKKDAWEELSPEQQEKINISIQKDIHGDVVDF